MQGVGAAISVEAQRERARKLTREEEPDVLEAGTWGYYDNAGQRGRHVFVEVTAVHHDKEPPWYTLTAADGSRVLPAQ